MYSYSYIILNLELHVHIVYRYKCLDTSGIYIYLHLYTNFSLRHLATDEGEVWATGFSGGGSKNIFLHNFRLDSMVFYWESASDLRF